MQYQKPSDGYEVNKRDDSVNASDIYQSITSYYTDKNRKNTFSQTATKSSRRNHLKVFLFTHTPSHSFKHFTSNISNSAARASDDTVYSTPQGKH